MKSISFMLITAVMALTQQFSTATGQPDAIGSTPAGGAATSDAVPSQYISEVFPVRYAKASEVADALNSLSRPGSAPSPRVQRLLQRAAPGSELHFQGEVKTVVDERSNSILIFGSRSDTEVARRIVFQLDKASAQLLIQAVIFELGSENSPHKETTEPSMAAWELIAKLLAGSSMTNFIVSSLTELDVVASTNGVSGHQNHYLAKLEGGFPSVVAALEHDPRIKIVQRPRVLTLDQERANIFIGQTHPVPANEAGGPSGGLAQLQTGLSVEVLPEMRPNGVVKMDLRLSTDEIEGSTRIEGVGDVPNVVTRSLQTTLTLRDGDTFILGDISSAAQKQPGKNLLLLINITILKTPEATAAGPGN
jgi:general secretion pathway protein D